MPSAPQLSSDPRPRAPSPIPRRESLWRSWLGEALAALRAIIGTPRYCVPALSTLALGIGAATGVYAVVHAVMLRPLPFENGSELVRAFAAIPPATEGAGPFWSMSAPFAEEFAEHKQVFASFSVSRAAEATVTDGGESRRVQAAQVTGTFFDTLRPRFVLGRGFTALGPEPDGLDGVVVSETFWRTALGARSELGMLLVDGKPMKLLGVVAREGSYPAAGDWVTELWFPITFSSAERSERFMMTFVGLGRLQPGLPFAVASARLRAVTEAQNIRSPTGQLVSSELTPLREVLAGHKESVLPLMLAAVSLFLLLACANVAALLVTRASIEAPDLAVRAALGASTGSLVRKSALEVFWLGSFGGGLGLVVAGGLAALANHWWVGELELTPARLSWPVLGMCVGVTGGAALLAGIAPALFARRVQPMAALRASGRGSGGRGARRLRELLVAVQVGGSVAMLGNAVLLLRSIQKLAAIDPGYDTSAVSLRVSYPPAEHADDRVSWDVPDPEARKLVRQLRERLARLTGIQTAIASDVPFDGGGPGLGFELGPGALTAHTSARVHLTAPGYFGTLGIPLIAGRDFSGVDLERSGVVIVSRAFATEVFGSAERAIGQRLTAGNWPETDDTWVRVVGVAEDTLDHDLWREPAREVYAPFTSNTRMHGDSFAIVARKSPTQGAASPPGDADALLDMLTALVREVSPAASVFKATELGTLSTQSYDQQRALERVLGLFALASLALAAIGLFGVTSYSVAERSRELGIRRAVGASRNDILLMILRETGVVVVVGVAMGLGLAYFSGSLLERFLYEVTTYDPGVYVGVSVVVAFVALVAALSGARAAAGISPTRALVAR